MYIKQQLSIKRNITSKFFDYYELQDGFLLDLFWTTFIYCNHKVKHWK